MTNIEVKTKSIFNSLNQSEKKVAEYFLKNVDNVFSLPIAQLAKESGASQVSWVRFCKTLGYDGLKGLKKSLFIELNETNSDTSASVNNNFSDIKDFQNLADIENVIRTSSIKAIEDTMTLINMDEILQLATIILNARSILLFGIGASALVAEDLYNKFLRIGLNVIFCRDNHVQLTYATNSSDKDVAIFISNSGLTNEIIETIDLVKQSQTTTIGITRFQKSPLVSKSDYQLYISSPETYKRSGAMSSRIAQSVVIDVLFTTLAHEAYDKVEDKLKRSHEACKKHQLPR